MFNPADYLTQLLAQLRALLFAHEPTVAAARAPIFRWLHNYVARTQSRLLRLFTLWQQHRLPAPRPRRNPSAQPLATPAAPQENPPAVHPRISRSRAWLLREIGRPAAALNGLLAHLIAQPEFETFLREVPRAGRLLRPLLRILNADPMPPVLALPPRPRAPRPGPPRRETRGGKYPRFNPYTYSPGRIPTFKKVES